MYTLNYITPYVKYIGIFLKKQLKVKKKNWAKKWGGVEPETTTATKNRQHEQKTSGKMVDLKVAAAKITSNVNIENVNIENISIKIQD